MHATVDVHHHHHPHHNLPPRLTRAVHPFPSYPSPPPPPPHLPQRNLPPRHRYHYSPPSSHYQTTRPLPLPLPCRAPTRPSRPLLSRSYIFQGPFHEDNNNPHQQISRQPLFFKWAKPIGRFCTLNTDGSVSSHRSGVGGILRDSRGAPLDAFAAMCPTNIPIYGVELIAIMKGLQVAISSGVHYINIDTDSSEAVKYVFSPPPSCPMPIRSCISEIHSLLAQFKSWTCKHVFRETNRAADFLAKFAGTNELLLDPMQFPFELQKIINEDARGVLYLRLKSIGMS